jgi:hypothetical protein
VAPALERRESGGAPELLEDAKARCCCKPGVSNDEHDGLAREPREEQELGAVDLERHLLEQQSTAFNRIESRPGGGRYLERVREDFDATLWAGVPPILRFERLMAMVRYPGVLPQDARKQGRAGARGETKVRESGTP